MKQGLVQCDKRATAVLKIEQKIKISMQRTKRKEQDTKHTTFKVKPNTCNFNIKILKKILNHIGIRKNSLTLPCASKIQT